MRRGTVRPRRIYLSCPSELAEASHQDVRNLVLQQLIDCGWVVDEFHRSGKLISTAWTFDASSEAMRTSQGAVILALPRRAAGDSTNPSPTVSEFSHFEGALAVAHRVPRFTIVAEGAPERGITMRGAGNFVSLVPSAEHWDSSGLIERLRTWLDGLDRRRDVFLAYCGAARPTAQAIKLLLTKSGVSVLDWSADFANGETIIDEVDRAVRECRLGLFLLTKDDQLKAGGPAAAAPRDNVVFEAGYFMSQKGRRQTLVIREDGTKMPADLGGVIYLPLQDRNDVSPLEAGIRAFLDADETSRSGHA